MFSAAWDDEKSVIYLLLLLVRHGQNNYFFGRTKLEKIRTNVVAQYTKKDAMVIRNCQNISLYQNQKGIGEAIK